MLWKLFTESITYHLYVLKMEYHFSHRSKDSKGNTEITNCHLFLKLQNICKHMVALYLFISKQKKAYKQISYLFPNNLLFLQLNNYGSM